MKKMIFCFAALLIGAGCSVDRSIPAVKNWDVKRYMGLWYEVARLPNRFEKNMTGVSTVYSLGKNGQVKVVNKGIRAGKEKSITGKARAVIPQSGELEVSFFGPFYAPYRIIKLAPDYRYSVVTGGSKELLWILARRKNLSFEDLKEIKAFLEENHFPVERLIWSWK